MSFICVLMYIVFVGFLLSLYLHCKYNFVEILEMAILIQDVLSCYDIQITHLRFATCNCISIKSKLMAHNNILGLWLWSVPFRLFEILTKNFYGY